MCYPPPTPTALTYTDPVCVVFTEAPSKSSLPQSLGAKLAGFPRSASEGTVTESLLLTLTRLE